MSGSEDVARGESSLRIDRWLWYTRFFKTRGMAADAVRGGHVRVHGQRVKPAHGVKVGDTLRILRGLEEFEVTVTGIPQRRGPAAEARGLYVESEASAERRRQRAERSRAEAAMEAPTRGRPDKRTRRLIRSRRLGG